MNNDEKIINLLEHILETLRRQEQIALAANPEFVTSIDWNNPEQGTRPAKPTDLIIWRPDEPHIEFVLATQWVAKMASSGVAGLVGKVVFWENPHSPTIYLDPEKTHLFQAFEALTGYDLNNIPILDANEDYPRGAGVVSPFLIETTPIRIARVRLNAEQQKEYNRKYFTYGVVFADVNGYFPPGIHPVITQKETQERPEGDLEVERDSTIAPAKRGLLGKRKSANGGDSWAADYDGGDKMTAMILAKTAGLPEKAVKKHLVSCKGRPMLDTLRSVLDISLTDIQDGFLADEDQEQFVVFCETQIQSKIQKGELPPTDQSLRDVLINIITPLIDDDGNAIPDISLRDIFDGYASYVNSQKG